MGLETAQYVEDLNPLWPLSTDKKQEGDDQFRLIKSVLQNMTASQAQVTNKDDRVWLSAAALAMDINFTGDITKSGVGFATLGANTFTAIQYIETSSGDSSVQVKSPVNTISSVALYEDNKLSGLFFNEYSENSVNIRKYDSAGTTTNAQLDLREDGVINARVGQLRQGNVDVATVGANTFTATQTLQQDLIHTGGVFTMKASANDTRTIIASGSAASGSSGAYIALAGASYAAPNDAYLVAGTGGDIFLNAGGSANIVNVAAGILQQDGVNVATVDQISAPTYAGYSDIDAIVTAVPEGWAIEKAGPGLYRVVHNLGLLESEIYPVVTAHEIYTYCQTETFVANSFLIVIRDVRDASFLDGSFSFVCVTQ